MLILQSGYSQWGRTCNSFNCRHLTEMKLVQIIKLARKSPTGDVHAFKTNAVKDEEEALDENELT